MLDTAESALAGLVQDWLNRLERAISSDDAKTLRTLFVEESYWRDAVALSWQLQTVTGAGSIVEALAHAARSAGLSELRLDPEAPAPRRVTRVETETLEAFFLFRTETGHGRGIVRLVPEGADSGALRAWTLLTSLEGLSDFTETTGANRPTGQANARDFRGPNWLDQRRAATAFEDREPAVVVVGAGQAGLSIAARLTQLGVDTLVVDRHSRVGDNWRLRYHALTLHNQVQVNHLPYMPFPPNWPTYIPKDKLAGWFEAYAEAMELNIWTSTTLGGGRYDEGAGCWTLSVQRDGMERTLRPRHLVMATGVSGIPNLPDIPTLDAFGGTVLHSGAYTDGEDWSGKRAIVIGTGNSGHDIAQDLHSSGAAVTLVQRRPTLIVNIEPSAQLPYTLYDEGPCLEDCDLITVSMPVPLTRRAHIRFTERARDIDSALLERLEARGFRLDFGEDGTGWQFKYLTRGGGYYFNVGCSDMIADGLIDLIAFDQISHFTATGADLRDGSSRDADLIVLATGYKGQEALIARLFGDDMAARIGPVWGFGEGIELRNMYVRTPQPGLFFIAGSLAQCRINSKFLALQIKAIEAGLISPTPADAR